ncbi:MAG TPA: L-rhamnose isomerase [Bacteroidales bacterium]|nr:L-rhamnose isomerase [Bacteroidales bacterium]
MKTRAFGAVYDYHCMVNGVPAGDEFIEEIQQYEQEELANR